MSTDNDGIARSDLVGIGIGPSNLSLAALLRRVPEFAGAFFERQRRFTWHDGMLLPKTTIQTSLLKDLVTLVDPTNPYSFLAFLHAQKRLYRFIHCEFPRVSRREFKQYFEWVSAQLPGLRFGCNVEEVQLHGDEFEVVVHDRRVRTKAIVLASGLTPTVPEAARQHLGPRVFHGYDVLRTSFDPTDRSIAVVGGGQTGAEIFSWLIGDAARLPACAHWITRRYNFLPLDESPFTNELFSPAYSSHFRRLSAETRAALLRQQVLTSDGISDTTLRDIYRRLYELEFLEGAPQRVSLWPGRELVGVSRSGAQYDLAVLNQADGQRMALKVDFVILCTGARYELPPYLEPLRDRLAYGDGGLEAEANFVVSWDGPPGLRIYAQNAARHACGIADPNLSLLAWRSASIVNHLANRRVYDLDETGSAIGWGEVSRPRAAQEVRTSDERFSGSGHAEVVLSTDGNVG